MRKLAETFIKRIESALSAHGAQAEFIKKAGISRVTLHRWLNRENVPGLDQVEAAAAALDRPVIDLLFPGELPKPVVMKPTPEQALAVLQEALAEKRPEATLTGIRRELFDALSALDDSEVAAELATLRLKAEARARRKSTDSQKRRG